MLKNNIIPPSKVGGFHTMEKKNKDINTQRLEAIIEDMKIQLKEMEKIRNPLRVFFRFPGITKLLLLNNQIKHLKIQRAIANGKFDNKFTTILRGDALTPHK